MEPERFRELLDAYGAEPDHWPPAERSAMEHFARDRGHAAPWLAEAQRLDQHLARYQVSAPDLSARILKGIESSLPERFLAWLLPSNPVNWWRPAFAGAMPLVLGVALSLSGIDYGFSEPETYSWELEERALLAAPSLEAWYE